MATLNYNTGALGGLSSTFADKASEFEGKVTSIIASVTAMGDNWKGEVYTAFKTKMESFRDGTFAEIKQELDVWSGKFSEAQQKSSQLTSTLTSEW
ncbi:MAG: WXG100 family type VII secretion target [Bacilli bacterium]|nr:WXG100 family type VII secretion target [Bacilli bacterium]